MSSHLQFISITFAHFFPQSSSSSPLFCYTMITKKAIETNYYSIVLSVTSLIASFSPSSAYTTAVHIFPLFFLSPSPVGRWQFVSQTDWIFFHDFNHMNGSSTRG